jgi:hypothetical protein
MSLYITEAWVQNNTVARENHRQAGLIRYSQPLGVIGLRQEG